MRVVNIRLVIIGETYEDIVKKSEERLSSFIGVPVEELPQKANYEFLIFQSSDDGVELPKFTAEVLAKLK